MEYNFTHIDNIEYFVADNITEYVNSTKPLEYKKYVKYYKDAGYDEGTAKKLAENIPTNSVIEVYLLNRFKSLLENREKQELFDKRLDEVNKPNVTEIKKEIKKRKQGKSCLRSGAKENISPSVLAPWRPG